MLDVTYILPNGEPAARVSLLYPTVNIQTLEAIIAVGAYDKAGNLCETIAVPYKLDRMRDIPVDEQEQAVMAYFNSRAANAPA